MKSIITLSVLLFATLFSAGSQTIFPNDFYGTYKGTLQINSEKGNSTYPMEFRLAPTDSVGITQYQLIYGEGEQRQVRPYTLKEKDREKGQYIVDENNGIILDDKVIDNRMYSLFEVGGMLLTTFITFEKDHMVFEIAVAKREAKRVTHAEDEEKTEVISYPIMTVQRAILQKQ